MKPPLFTLLACAMLSLSLAPCLAQTQAQLEAPNLQSEIIDREPPLTGDSRQSNIQWNEFFHSKQGLFAPKIAYKVALDYKILARNANTQFYFMFRRVGMSGAGDQGQTFWTDPVGQTGQETATLLALQGDYYLLIGIKNQGAIAIKSVTIATDPEDTPHDVHLPMPTRAWTSPGHTAYYVDSISGDDANNGSAPKRAWKSLDRINTGTFGPGDRILLKSGSRWTDALTPGGSGAAGQSIRLDSYGAGPKPRIDAHGQFLATLYLHNQEYWDVSSLDIANSSPWRQPSLTGVQVRLDDFGTAHEIHLRYLDVHDVHGSNVKNAGGGEGISCGNYGARLPSRFDGLLIEECHLTRTDRNGITMNSDYWHRDKWFPSLHVVIRKNRLDDIGGDGIVPIGCDGALVAGNVLHGGRMRALDYAAGIWPWSCDNTVVQHNEVSGMKGTNDGEGYDSDFNCRNTLIQYNYSHDNDGGFMLICNDGSLTMPVSAGNTGTVIRYNISIHDHDPHVQYRRPREEYDDLQQRVRPRKRSENHCRECRHLGQPAGIHAVSKQHFHHRCPRRVQSERDARHGLLEQRILGPVFRTVPLMPTP